MSLASLFTLSDPIAQIPQGRIAASIPSFLSSPVWRHTEILLLAIVRLYRFIHLSQPCSYFPDSVSVHYYPAIKAVAPPGICSAGSCIYTVQTLPKPIDLGTAYETPHMVPDSRNRCGPRRFVDFFGCQDVALRKSSPSRQCYCMDSVHISWLENCVLVNHDTRTDRF